MFHEEAFFIASRMWISRDVLVWENSIISFEGSLKCSAGSWKKRCADFHFRILRISNHSELHSHIVISLWLINLVIRWRQLSGWIHRLAMVIGQNNIVEVQAEQIFTAAHIINYSWMWKTNKLSWIGICKCMKIPLRLHHDNWPRPWKSIKLGKCRFLAAHTGSIATTNTCFKRTKNHRAMCSLETMTK